MRNDLKEAWKELGETQALIDDLIELDGNGEKLAQWFVDMAIDRARRAKQRLRDAVARGN